MIGTASVWTTPAVAHGRLEEPENESRGLVEVTSFSSNSLNESKQMMVMMMMQLVSKY